MFALGRVLALALGFELALVLGIVLLVLAGPELVRAERIKPRAARAPPE